MGARLHERCAELRPPIRVLNVTDVLSREALACEVDTSLPAIRVVRVLEEIALERGYPASIRLDNGSELRSRVMDQWAYEHSVTLDFIQPGKPIQNAMVESFNGKMRDELLNASWWNSLNEARAAIEAHREDYNRARPHDSLGRRTPEEYARTLSHYINQQRLASPVEPALG
jgi:putative transposase